MKFPYHNILSILFLVAFVLIIQFDDALRTIGLNVDPSRKNVQGKVDKAPLQTNIKNLIEQKIDLISSPENDGGLRFNTSVPNAEDSNMIKEHDKPLQSEAQERQQKSNHVSIQENNDEADAVDNYLIQHAKQLRLEAQELRKMSNQVGNKTKDNVHFFTYATNDLAKARERIVIEAECSGWFESVHGFTPDDLPEKFQLDMHEILSLQRGGGYWIWKFPLLERMLLELTSIGDYLLYADAGCWVHHPAGTDRLQKWVQLLKDSPHDILSFQLGHIEDTWTTEHVFQAFNVSIHDKQIRETGQIMATVFLVRNGPDAREALAKIYEALSKDPFIVTDKYNPQTMALRKEQGSDRAFSDNRHDQSLNSVALKLHGSVVLQDETYPARLYSSSPILAARIGKVVSDRALEKMRRWKNHNCSGSNPLRAAKRTST